MEKEVEKTLEEFQARQIIRKALQSIGEEMRDRKNGITNKIYPTTFYIK